MFFYLKQSFVFSFYLTFSVSVKLGETVTYPGLEVVSLCESGPLWSVHPVSVGRARSEGSTSHVFLQGEVAACDLVGGGAGV